MNGISKKRCKGVTLIELMVTVLLIAIAVIGAMGFRYFCALDARKADVQITGARLGWMLLENWKGAGGDPNYTPQLNGTPLEAGAPGPAPPAGLQLLDIYHAFFDGVHYYATLSWDDVTSTNNNETTVLRILNVNVAWMNRGQQWDGSGRTLGVTTHMNIN